MRFDGKRVLVTGGTRGAGAAMAVAFAREGARCAVNARSRSSVDAFMEAHEGDYLPVPGEIGERDACFDVVARAVEGLGGLDVLVANAGIFDDKPFEDVTQADFDRVIAVNLGGVFFCIQATIPHLRETRGAVVATASDAGLISYAGDPAYSASKGGVVSLVRSLAIAYAEEGIRVNCICPGNIDTDMMRNAAAAAPDPEDYDRQARARAPMRRMARPEEVAAAALYLASDEAGFTTGVALPVDGGGTAGFD